MAYSSSFKRTLLGAAKRVVKLIYHDTKVAAAYLNRSSLKKLKILSAHDGNQHHPSNVYAIFLIWQPGSLRWYIENALNALNANGINVIVVANHTLSREQVSLLKEKSYLVIERDNTGLDIGGYRDATLYLHSVARPKRVIYMNDSVYYFMNGLNPIFKRLSSSESDICGTFENYEHCYHIQSFCFSVSGHLFCKNSFLKFWENYLPVNSRLWAIQQGEIALSKMMVPLANKVEVIFRPDDLIEALSKIHDEQREELNALLPRKIRFDEVSLNSIPPSDIPLAFAKKVALRSQVHTGAFLYRRYLGCPIMKRDLLYRLQFSIHEIQHVLEETGSEGHLEEIISELEAKGTPEKLSLIKQVRVAVGIL
ncbi:rhamnan synthesis F family protein [Ochrobactrum quorumnocens]|uniref:rhamnan synthesis F family protein n=1 Tax=Ochrobactrum quorumnocens TaxID=271865 RepID=UPI003BA2DB1D